MAALQLVSVHLRVRGQGVVLNSSPELSALAQERLPLAVDAALALGCCAGVGAAARERPLTEGFDCTELEVRRAANLTQHHFVLHHA